MNIQCTIYIHLISRTQIQAPTFSLLDIMYIEEIILEGFKSYATRTVISGWDPEFNAITGLNGSGKSNILDGICFVLGIDNLRQIRATSLQDLVYKRGQAGITKATVTLVFNNQDSTQSPVGFQDSKQIIISRQIVLGGKNTFKINGITVPQNRLEMLFKSVQLNINNPHFLIMQGRITKVLNMKPIELISMIEEAAGTRMYEERKEKAQITIEKKEIKVQEISNLLHDTIIPKMEKLKQERDAYLEYQLITENISKLEKQAIVVEYHSLLSQSCNHTKLIQDSHTNLDQNIKSLQEKQIELEDLSKHLESLRSEKKNQVKSKSLIDSEDQVNNCLKQLASIQTRLDIQKQQNLQYEQQRIDIFKEIESLSLIQDNSLLSTSYDSTKQQYEDKKKELNSLEELYNGLTTGVTRKKGEQVGYAKLVQQERGLSNQLQAEYHKTELSRQQIEEELSSLLTKKTLLQDAFQRMEQEISTEEKKYETKKKELEAFGIENDETIVEKKKKLERQLGNIKADIDNLYNEVAFSPFEYSNPGSGFNPKAVKGFIIELVNIPSNNNCWANALEICAGGRLYNVVVETEQDATALLEHGKLKKRITIIPLNKIQPYVIPKEKISRLEKEFPNQAHLALSLIGFENNLLPAMQYVFGGSILCNDKNIANNIAYKSLGLKCITIDGDVYDPSGTMTGGSNANSSGILNTLAQVNRLKDEQSLLEKELNQVITQLKQIEKKRNMVTEYENEIELIHHNIQLKKSKFQTDPSCKSYRRMLELQSSLNDITITLKDINERLKISQLKLSEYQTSHQEATKDPSSKLKEIQLKIELIRDKQLPKLSNELEKLSESKTRYEVTKMTREEDIKRKKKESSQLDEMIREGKLQLKNLDQELNTSKHHYEQAQRQFDMEKAKLAETDVNMKRIEQSFKSCQDEITRLEKKIKKMEHDIQKMKEELEGWNIKLNASKSKYSWIEQMEHDPNNNDLEQIYRQIHQLKQKLKNTDGNINNQVLEMLDSLEKKEMELKEHLRMVQDDKDKIERTIVKLNEYKKESLEKTWKQVNQDFGEIFSMLLPGGFAQLNPFGDSIESGVEIQVRLGSIWKKNLGELSGGQRSLAALSFILSLLQFKPAPMYILDEIDAALDPSHTQNIGKLFKHKFKESQFIVVSLKDGLFTNANVLFRTRFVDGISMVERNGEIREEKKKITKQHLLKVEA